MDERSREQAARRRAKKLGLVLRKSRAKTLSVDNQGGYALIDAQGNYDVAGRRFELSLDDVESWLTDRERA